jgi:hypothetical protein
MLGIVPFDQAVTHILAVPCFDLAELLRAMRRQTSRAALQLKALGARTAQVDARPERGRAGVTDGRKTPPDPAVKVVTDDTANEPARKGKQINERMMKKLQRKTAWDGAFKTGPTTSVAASPPSRERGPGKLSWPQGS